MQTHHQDQPEPDTKIQARSPLEHEVEREVNPTSHEPSSQSALSAVTLRVWRASGLSVLGVTIFELISLLRESAESSLGGTVAHIVGLYLLFLIVYTMCSAALFPSLALALPHPKRWIGLGLNEQERTRYVRQAVTLGVSFALVIGVISIATLTSRGFNRDSLAVAWVVIALVAGTGLAAVIAPAVSRLIGWTLNQACPSAQVGPLPLSVLPATCVGVLFILGGVMMSRLNLGAYQLDGYLLLGSLLPLTIAIYTLETWWGSKRSGSSSEERRAPRPLIPLLLTPVVCIPLSLWLLSGWEVTHPSNQLIPQQAQLSSLILAGARRITDSDGDGVSAILGGGDCDDANAQVSPLMREIPDNGIDDNCANGDAQTPPPPEPAPKAKPQVSAHQPKAWNVLFLLVDTLRASHLPLHGYSRPTMPNLTSFAEDAVVFERAFAHAPRTPFSIPSALIGRYPSRIDWVKRFKNYSVLTDKNETMFERLRTAGWRTEAVSAHWYFGAKKAVNLNQGLDQWDNRGERSVSESNTQSEAKQITRRLIERMRALKADSNGSQKPFMLFGHYFAPHGRYMNHRVKCKRSKNWCHTEPRCAEHATQCIFGDPKAKSVKKLINKYDSELAYTDLHLGDVLRAYRELGLDKDTVIIITSDHGESFKDRKPRFLFHGHHVYNEELHVPLIIRTPESRPQRRQEVVGLVDVSPTLSALTGTPSGVVDGVSLAPLLRSEAPTDEALAPLHARTLFLEQLPYPGHKVHMVAGLSSDGLKAVRNLTSQTWEVFNLSQDWGEQRNLKKIQEPGLANRARQLKAKVSQFIELTP